MTTPTTPPVTDAEVLAFAARWGAATTGPGRRQITADLDARLADVSPFDRFNAMCLFRARRWDTARPEGTAVYSLDYIDRATDARRVAAVLRDAATSVLTVVVGATPNVCTRIDAAVSRPPDVPPADRHELPDLAIVTVANALGYDGIPGGQRAYVERWGRSYLPDTVASALRGVAAALDDHAESLTARP